MTNILFVTSNPRGDPSVSPWSGGAVLKELMNAHPQAKVVVRDLAQDPPQHGDQPAADRPDALIDELLAADILVLAVPTIRFSMPSALKAWVDHVSRRGRTFRYEDGRPRGLLTGRRAIIIQIQAGDHSSAQHYQAPYLRQMLGFLGITDIEVVEVQGPSVGFEPALAEDRSARRRIVGLPAAGPYFPISHRSTGEVAPDSLYADASGRHAPPHPQWTPLGSSAARSKPLRTHWPHGGVA
jgi:FMN-dependent NADH-azoreductase